MSIGTNTPRLLAAAKEFSIGKETLVEFLRGKGFEIDASKPTAKLTEEMYSALQNQFAQDKYVKRKSESIALPKGSLIDQLNNITDRSTLTKELSLLKHKQEAELNDSQKGRLRLLERFESYDDDTAILDFSNLNLEKVPSEIYYFINLKKINLKGNAIRSLGLLGGLNFLEEIDISDNALSDISELNGLIKLKNLRARNNNIRNIPNDLPLSIELLDLGQNKISTITPLSQFTNLHAIDISFNRDINNISSLFLLTGLKSLISRGNSVSDVSGIESLVQLQHLDLAANKIQSITSIFEMRSLQVLLLNDNVIENIDSISRLSSLNSLNLSNNKIFDIAPLEELIKRNKNVVVNIANNDLSDIKLSSGPTENHTSLLIEYFSRANFNNTDDTVALNFVHLLILGNGESGKTSLLNVLRETYLSKESKSNKSEKLEKDIPELPSESTHGNVHYYWNLTFKDRIREKYTVLVKDFGGQEYYHHFHPIFYHPQALYWITNSLEIADDIRVDNGLFDPTYWFYNITHYLRHHHSIEEKNPTQIWLLNTKVDKASKNKQRNYYRLFSETRDVCTLNREQIENLDFLQRQKYLSVREQVYYEFRQQIEKSSEERMFKLSWEIFQFLKDKSNEHSIVRFIFTKNDFCDFLKAEIVKDNNKIESNFETILNDLRYFGICLYFPENQILKDHIYLFPQKIASKIFEGILSKENLEEKNGIIGQGLLSEQEEIKNLLEHFEIIFQDGDTYNWIVPQYLPKTSDNNELLSLAIDGLDQELNIHFPDFMPQGIMSRLICYFGQNPYKKWYWRNGIFFTHDLVHTRHDRTYRKAMISADWENGFRIKIKANEIEELEKIFVKILLSYYNQSLKLNDASTQTNDLENINPKAIAYEAFLAKLKAEELSVSISLNSDEAIGLGEFKEMIDSLINIKYNGDRYSFNPYLKVKKYLPFLQYLIDTKDFQSMFNPKKVFISYSHKDSDVRQALDSHLKLMVRTGMVSTWHDMRIDIGTQWDKKIEIELKSADVVILLLSSDFFASDYIWNKEMPIIIEKLENNTCTVIPILCRHCISNVSEIFHTGDFRFDVTSLQGLPIKDHKFVPIHSESFKYIDEAYEQIAKKLVELISKI